MIDFLQESLAAELIGLHMVANQTHVVGQLKAKYFLQSEVDPQ